MFTSNVARLLVVISATLCFVSSVEAARKAKGGFDALMTKANDIFTGKGDDFASYVALRDVYNALPPPEQRQAGQILSMIDAMFGRYEDADHHYGVSFPAKDPPACPMSPVSPTPVEASIATVAGSSRVLLLNESHSKVATRAAIIRMLPTLQRAGYTRLALEAVDPNSMSGLLRGLGRTSPAFVADTTKAGFYLREPVYARMVEDAVTLGFGLVPYESEAPDHDGREREQAAHLQQWLDEHPGERLVVVAGYSHIWKADGWMAEKLTTSLRQPVVAVDQIDGIAGCKGTSIQNAPSLWMNISHRAWSAHPDRVDATVTWSPVNRRGDPASWLSLGGRRKPVTFTTACHGTVPCLLSATTAGNDGGVPEDRVMLFRTSEKPVLYLTPGTYVVKARTRVGSKQWTLEVDPEGLAKGASGDSTVRATLP